MAPCTSIDFTETLGDGSSIVDDGHGWRRCNDNGYLIFNRVRNVPCSSDGQQCCSEAGEGVSSLHDFEIDCYYIPYTSTLGTFTVLLCVFGAFVNIIGLAWLVKNRTTRAVKAGQFHFLVLFVVGWFLVSVAALPFLGDITDGSCLGRSVLMNLGAALVYVSISVKIYRVPV